MPLDLHFSATAQARPINLDQNPPPAAAVPGMVRQS